MKVVFAGTPAFAEVALEALVAAGHDLRLVLTQPDRPSGRGLKLHPSPVKAAALRHGIDVMQPRSLRLNGAHAEAAAAARDRLTTVEADVMVVAAYGLILPQWVLDLPARGCLNIHGSLLPRWRGAAPIHRAIEAGDGRTGITIMQMDAGLDTGDMLLMAEEPIAAHDTTAALHDRLAALGARLIVDALATLDGLVPTPQPAEGVTYAHKVDKREADVDWTQPADAIARRIRAFDPFPGAAGTLGGDVIKLWSAHAVPGDGAPGSVLDASADGVVVACGQGAVCITELQRPGGKRLPARQFLQSAGALTGRTFAPRSA